MREYQQCKRCVMDTVADPYITFDENGFCNHCNFYFKDRAPRVYRGEQSKQKLSELVATIKKSGEGKKYDCVIAFSGGVDSSYLAYLAKKLGLRALLVHIDNEWNTAIAEENIKRLVEKLGFDFYRYKVDWDEFKDLQLSFLKASVPEAETPTDIALPAVWHQVAAEHGVKYILSGGNFITEGIKPKWWHYDPKDYKYIRAIQKQFGTKELKSFPVFDYKAEAYYKFIKGIRIIYFLNYADYKPDEALKTLVSEVGFQYYEHKHYESIYTKFIQAYYLPVKFNIDYRKATYSSKICSGIMTRDEALAMLQQKTYTEQELEEWKSLLCQKFEISRSELEEILARPPKFYYDYPNNKAFLEFIYSTYRLLKKLRLFK
jgi:N-acetyl sugar amidotransferase